MTTRGDQILDRPLAEIGGKGLFIKELEVAMQEGKAHLAVHSMKDVPMVMPEGFVLAAISARENPRDAFVSNNYAGLDELPAGAVVGTSSLRRESILRAKYPQLVIKSLRGNLDTRLKKLAAGEYDAIILAAAGLIRLGLIQGGLLESGAAADEVGDRGHPLLLGAPLLVAALARRLGLIRLFSRRTQPPGTHSDTPDNRRFDFTTTPCTCGRVRRPRGRERRRPRLTAGLERTPV